MHAAAVADNDGVAAPTIMIVLWSDDVALDGRSCRRKVTAVSMSLGNHPIELQSSQRGQVRLAIISGLRRAKEETSAAWAARSKVHYNAAMELVLGPMKHASSCRQELVHHNGKYTVRQKPTVLL